MTAPGAQEYGDRVEIRVRGGMMPVWLIGEGPPLLLLHGMSANHTEWLSVARLISTHYRVILPALLGPCPRVVLVSPVTPWTKRPKMLDPLRWSVLRTAILPIAGICRRPLTHDILTRRMYGDHRPNMTNAVSRYSAAYADRSRARASLEIRAYRRGRINSALNSRPFQGRAMDSPRKSRTCVRKLFATVD